MTCMGEKNTESVTADSILLCELSAWKMDLHSICCEMLCVRETDGFVLVCQTTCMAVAVPAPVRVDVCGCARWVGGLFPNRRI